MYHFSDETYYEDDSELEMDLKESNFRQNYQNSTNETTQNEDIKLRKIKYDNRNIIIFDSLIIILLSCLCLIFNLIIIKFAVLGFAIHLLINIVRKGNKIE